MLGCLQSWPWTQLIFTGKRRAIGGVRVLHKSIIDHASKPEWLVLEITFYQNPSLNFGVSFPTLAYSGIIYVHKTKKTCKTPVQKTNPSSNSFIPMGIIFNRMFCPCVSMVCLSPKSRGVAVSEISSSAPQIKWVTGGITPISGNIGPLVITPRDPISSPLHWEWELFGT